MKEICFRPARTEEIPGLVAMQADIFWKEQGIPKDDPAVFLQRKPRFWCAEAEGRICGLVAAWPEGDHIHWGRFVVDPAVRRRHIGVRLAKCSFDDIFAQGVREIVMDARDTTVKIVCDMGGEVVGQPQLFYGENLTHVILRRENYRPG